MRTKRMMTFLLTGVLALNTAACGQGRSSPFEVTTASDNIMDNGLQESVPSNHTTGDVLDINYKLKPEEITISSEIARGFINGNTLHSLEYGEIHYSSYIPKSYDGSRPYALFITLTGWEGLYFQGVGANMVEDYGTEAIKYNDEMIVLSTQLDDWGETSANMAIELTEYFLEHYNIDPKKVYLHGYSGGGETGSLVMGKRPDLYAAYLMTSSKWDGDLNVLAKNKTPVYMVTGENDSYYGSESLKNAFETIHDLYEEQGLDEVEISELLKLDVKDQKYFSDGGINDQHAGGFLFAHDEAIMKWLFNH